jgi:hypothetical protein
MGLIRDVMKFRDAGHDLATATRLAEADVDRQPAARPAAAPIQEDLSSWAVRHWRRETSARALRRQPVATATLSLQEDTDGTAGGKPDLAEWRRRHRAR